MRWRRSNRLRKTALQQTHALSQRIIKRTSSEQMNVIGHDYVTTNRNSALRAIACEFDKAVMHSRLRKHLASAMCIERHEIKWRIIFLEYVVQARRTVGHDSTMML